MALTIQLNKEDAGTGNKVVADRRLYLNADKTALVEEGDHSARSLFCAKGREVLRSELERFGVQVGVKSETTPKKAASSEKKGKGKGK